MNSKVVHFFCLANFIILQIAALALNAHDTHSVRPQRQVGQIDRITVSLEALGETVYFDTKGKEQREKLNVLCALEYYEKTLAVPATPDSVYRTIRRYDRAVASVKIGNYQLEPALQPEHKLVLAEAGDQVMLTPVVGNLYRAELDVIDVQASSILLDRLLPEAPVEVGKSWPHSSELIAAMLGLDEVSGTTVRSTFKEVTELLYRFELSGHVEGRSYGAKTSIELKGKYRFNRRIGRIDWIGLLIKEQRRPGPVTDGINVACRLQMTVAPGKTPEDLSETALRNYNLIPAAEASLLRHEFAGSGWTCLYERRWFAEGNGRVLRLLDGDKLIGQCDFAALPRSDVRRIISLEGFQEDIRAALKDSFGEFVEAAQTVAALNRRVLRVVVRGTARTKSFEVPIRWFCYHIADQEGNQAAITFTIEEDSLSRFADADRQIVASLRFEGLDKVQEKPPTVAQPKPASAGDRAAQSQPSAKR